MNSYVADLIRWALRTRKRAMVASFLAASASGAIAIACLRAGNSQGLWIFSTASILGFMFAYAFFRDSGPWRAP
ncbi:MULTISPECIES: hypothetical protein [Thalassobaculum]|uniref:Uncharacterized protein n=1 Tax=Thalassobaculum litoreum DSM 18839 TaxID=1123362 RepID=A0A8G2BFR1_9PROT|nr:MULTISPECIES: hypothetical protein [Thalassobaculum]SDF28398.1 hypothetical protein SAMN05660686_00887 [Thalassobaculum litoreum DSM 18839]